MGGISYVLVLVICGVLNSYIHAAGHIVSNQYRTHLPSFDPRNAMPNMRLKPLTLKG